MMNQLIILCCLTMSCKYKIESYVYHVEHVPTPIYNVESSSTTNDSNNNHCNNYNDDNEESISIQSACKIYHLSVDAMDIAIEARSTKITASSSLSSSSLSSSPPILPFVTLSFAQTLDGSIAPSTRTRLDISSKCSFQLLHSLRARHDGVMIGINTLQQDYPSLTVRQPLSTIDIPTIIQPRPIVIDSKLRFTSIDKILLNRPIIFTCYNRSRSRSCSSSCNSNSRGGSSSRSSSVDCISIDCDHLIDDIVNDHEDSSSYQEDEKWMQALDVIRRLDGDLVECKADAMGRCDLSDCLEILSNRFNMKSVLIEGGAGIIQSILEHELAQQLVLYIRPCFFGGYRSMNQQLLYPVCLSDINIASVDGDVVLYGKFENFLKYTSLQQQQPQDKHQQHKIINSNDHCDNDDSDIYSDDSYNTKSIDGDNNSNNTVLVNINTTNVNVNGNSTTIGANLNHYNKRRLVKFLNVLN